ELCHSLGTIERDGATGSSPRKLGHGNLAADLFRLRLRQSGPGDFGISEDDGRDCMWLECDFASGHGFDCSSALVHGLVGEHRLTHDVTNREDRGIIGLQLFVYLNEALRVYAHASFVEAGDFGVWLSSDRYQDFVENLLALFHVRTVEGGTNSAAFFFQRLYGGV